MEIITRLAYNQLITTEETPIVCLLIDTKGNKYVTKNSGNQHAEVLMCNQYDCENAIIFINVEPCPMCLFALSLAKVKYIFFGCENQQYGACGGKFHLQNHIDYKVPMYFGGFFTKINELMIKQFFANKRRQIMIY